MANKKFKGRLPEDPAVLEKEVDGVGRYTAGAISSMAYGVRTPIVDGNIHRLLTRLLALHAPQTAPATIKFLWTAAADLVGQLPIDDDREGIAGDWNQALMELGSQVCKPVSPDCAACPLQPACNAYSEVSGLHRSESNSRAECTLCAPIPLTTASDLIPSVQVFPMKKEKKASREEEESVLVLEWRGSGHDEGQEGTRKWLYVKRPEKGLLAGLYEPPTTPVNIINSATASASVKSQQYLEASLSALKVYIDLSSQDIATIIEQARYIGSIPHIFSHINMKYHIIHSVLSAPTAASDSSTGNGNGHQLPEILDTAPRMAVWLDAHEVEHANVGTGVKKVWSEVYGSWGSFEPTTGGISANANDGGIRKRKTGASGGGGSGKEAVGARAKTKTLEKNSLSADGDGLVSDHSGSRKVVRKIMMPVMPVRSNKRIKVDQ
ncbi:A/G-specific adenine glycosylase [Kwoniella heveanensis CBS 569]|nr:A/G-specific adenine glycosylase [Kwoniella heveanensis CBS 569]